MKTQIMQSEVAEPTGEARGFGNRSPVLARNLDDCPVLARIVALLDRSPAKLALVPGISGLLDEFQESGELSLLLKQEFERTMFTMSPPPLGNSFMLYQSSHYTLSCDGNSYSGERRLLTTLPCTAHMRLLRSDKGVAFLHYRLPVTTNMSILDTKTRLQLVHGDTMSLENPKTFVEANDVIELKGRGSTLTLTLRENSMSPFTWAFDPITHTPLFITVSDQSYNRWRILIELMVKFHGTAYASVYSSDLLVRLADHELHFLRWSACQALAKTDLATARRVIAKLSTDPHSHVRRAACAAMNRIQELETVI